MVAVPCPSCNNWINTPNGRMPSRCPSCGHSFTAGRAAEPRSARPAAPTLPPKIPRLQPQPPLNTSLYYDSPETEPGKLRTRHFERDGLPARAEAWGREMRQMDAQRKQLQTERERSFEEQKKALLAPPKSSAAGQLKNIYAGEADFDGAAQGSAVDLRGLEKPTPGRLRPPQKDAAPEAVMENPLAALSDEQLEQKKQAVQKALREIQALQLQNVLGYDALEADAREGREAAKQATLDAAKTVAFGALESAAKTPADLKAAKDGAAGADALEAADTLRGVWSGQTAPREALERITPVALSYTLKMAPLLKNFDALPGAVKSGFDTALVWSRLAAGTGEYARQEELRRLHEIHSLHLMMEQQRILREQQRRSRT